MIHVLTVHWKSSEWIDIQLRYLSAHLSQPYQTYAFLNYIPQVNQHLNKFDYANKEDIDPHAIKLNLLADMACFNAASDDDLLMFIDGDAFPVAPLDDFIKDKLASYPLLAIQRLENNGDQQPHPCFCVTTVGFWKAIKGDWKPGNKPWRNEVGDKVRDVGGILYHRLNERNQDWYKMLRSNQHQYLNQVMFGVYDGLIYHHGAGFRPPRIRADKKNVKNFRFRKAVFKKMKKYCPWTPP
jgi:hypothetical protein